MDLWEELIIKMLKVRNDLYIADKNRLWQYYYPEVAATQREIDNIQNKLKITLSNDYMNFLLCANGWQCFYQMVDLFGTCDLMSDKSETSKKLLNIEMEYDERLKKLDGYLLPIAASRNDKDLFVMSLKKEPNFGEVIWLAGGEVDRFSTFVKFFESMVEYNKEELEDILIDN